jgi:Flp pilus assembly CpaF family ATPase
MDRLLLFNHGDGSQRTVPLDKDRLVLGRSSSCDIVLPSPFISKEQAILERENGRIFLRNVGLNPVRVKGREIGAERVEVVAGKEFRIGTFGLLLESGGGADSGSSGSSPAHELVALERALHAELLKRLDLRSFAAAPLEDTKRTSAVEDRLEALLAERVPPLPASLKDHIVAESLRLAAVDDLLARPAGGRHAAPRAPAPPLAQVLRDMTDDLFRALGAQRRPETLRADLKLIDEGFAAAHARLRSKLPPGLVDSLAVRHLQRDLRNLIFGLGPLQDLLEMPTVSEIMVVGRDRIYVEKHGVIEETGRSFLSDEILMAVIERIVAPLGRRIDRASPIVDARLPDGSRVHAVIPPVALQGPTLTIRKFSRVPLTADDLVAGGTLTREAVDLLHRAVTSRRNIVISGGAGSGKTTLLNVLSSFIPPGERVITIEDAAELQLAQDHIVSLETRPASLEGRGTISMRDLVRTALRMRPDRIIVGECRGPEALDMLQAMNTGHAGSMTTTHANSAADALLRLEMMVLMAAELPVLAIRQQIAAAVHVLVHVERAADGTRQVTSIAELDGFRPKSDALAVRELFVRRGGALGTTGEKARFLGEGGA